jgi:hypothetical protein
MTLFDYQQGLYVPPPPPPKRRWGRVVIALSVLAAVGIASLLAISNRQHLVDQWTVWNYDTPPVIAAYIERSTMTDHGAFLFKASQPEVATAETFNSVCASQEEGSGILGCYTSGDRKITLFDVTDERLDGIEEVVASHEMLHAAWDRMSLDQQAELTPLLEAEAAKLADDPEFSERMAYYARTEPGERDNELHSIIGTEVAELDPALEEYYAQYFGDRASLVALHVASNAVFVELESASAALVSELDSLRAGIEADLASYNSGYDTLNADISSFNAKADSGGFATQEEFDAARAALLSRRDSLDALFDDITARNTTYEQKSDQLEALNAQAAALNTAINIVPRTSEGTE